MAPYAHSCKVNDAVLNGNSSMTPAVSPRSVTTCTTHPSATPTVTARLRRHSHTNAATTKPKVTVCVTPMPGQPRCHWCGTDAP